MNYFELAQNAVGKDEFKPNEKIELWVRFWRGEKHPRILEELITIYEPMIKKILIVNMNIPEIEFDDCVQMGRLALIKTVPNFDPTRKILFYSYARKNIVGEVKRYFRDKASHIRLPAWFQKAKDIFENGKMSQARFERYKPDVQQALINELSVCSYDEVIIDDDSDHLVRQIVGSLDTQKEVIFKMTMDEICLTLDREDSEILLKVLDDYRISEIARSMDLPVSYASRKLAKIRKKLSSLLTTGDVIN
jgi:RNA polymerase sigma factor (sigma-70 family)